MIGIVTESCVLRVPAKHEIIPALCSLKAVFRLIHRNKCNDGSFRVVSLFALAVYVTSTILLINKIQNEQNVNLVAKCIKNPVIKKTIRTGTACAVAVSPTKSIPGHCGLLNSSQTSEITMLQLEDFIRLYA